MTLVMTVEEAYQYNTAKVIEYHKAESKEAKGRIAGLIYQATMPMLKAMCKGIPRADHDDLLQDAFLCLVRRIGRPEALNQLNTVKDIEWAYQHAKSEYERARLKGKRFIGLDQSGIEPSEEPSIDRNMLLELIRKNRRAIGLSESQYSLLEEYYSSNDLSLRELAEKLCRSYNTVTDAKKKAVTKIRVWLTKTEGRTNRTLFAQLKAESEC